MLSFFTVKLKITEDMGETEEKKKSKYRKKQQKHNRQIPEAISLVPQAVANQIPAA